MTASEVPGHVWQAAVDAAVERIIGAPAADHDPAELIGIRQTVLDVLNASLTVLGPHLNPAGGGGWEYGIRDPEDDCTITLDETKARHRSRPGNDVGWQLVRRNGMTAAEYRDRYNTEHGEPERITGEDDTA